MKRPEFQSAAIAGLVLASAMLAPAGAFGAKGRDRPYRSSDFGIVRSTAVTPVESIGNSHGRISGTFIGKGTWRSKGATVTVTGSDSISYSGPNAVISAENGDKLFMSGTGHGTFSPQCITARTAADGCVVTMRIVETWTGGTGRFKGASGTAIARSRSDLISSDGKTSKFVVADRLIGTIRF